MGPQRGLQGESVKLAENLRHQQRERDVEKAAEDECVFKVTRTAPVWYLVIVGLRCSGTQSMRGKVPLSNQFRDGLHVRAGLVALAINTPMPVRVLPYAGLLLQG
jgi:hypothetical protein